MRLALGLRVFLLLLSCGLTAGGFAQGDVRSPIQAATSTRVSVSEGLLDGAVNPAEYVRSRAFLSRPRPSAPFDGGRRNRQHPGLVFERRLSSEYGACRERDA